MSQAAESPNPFKLLADIKENTSITDKSISKNLKIQTQNGLHFLSNLGINSIPVLVSEMQNKGKKILTGSDKIIPFWANTIHTPN